MLSKEGRPNIGHPFIVNLRKAFEENIPLEYKHDVQAIWAAVDAVKDNFVRQIVIESESTAKLATRDGKGLKARIEQAGYKITHITYDHLDTDGDMNTPFWSTFTFEIPTNQ